MHSDVNVTSHAQVFSFIFFVELVITHLAIGVIKYWTQIMTAFDGVIVLASLLEFYVSGGFDNLIY